jgi:iron(III) transport system substrate-binding protein
MGKLIRRAFLILVVAFVVVSEKATAAQSDAGLLQAKKEAEARGFIFVTSHDEIVAKAKAEGTLRILNGFEKDAIKALQEGFSKKYPFIKTRYEDVAGESAPRLMLELKTGRPVDWDIVHVNASMYSEYASYLEKMDLLQMGAKGVLQIPPKMVSPDSGSVVAAATILDVIVYNKSLLPAQLVPRSWEDLLQPEYKGKKFLLDIRPFAVAALVPAMGKEWVVNYARRLAAQDPLWMRGSSRALTGMAVGEFSIALSPYHSIVMQKRRGGEDLEATFLEPVPTRLSDIHGILKGAKHPHAAMLFLEYAAGPEGQKILDETEVKSSVYSPGTKLEQLVRGKKISVIDWNHLDKQAAYEEEITAAYGFPKAGK